jgi:hypothetical protein
VLTKLMIAGLGLAGESRKVDVGEHRRQVGLDLAGSYDLIDVASGTAVLPSAPTDVKQADSAIGHRWSDVDLEAGIVRISRQRVVVGGTVREGAPKTSAGVRTMAIDPATVALLRS